MEDAHSTVLDIASDNSDSTDTLSNISFFGVFDGHGGEKVALFSGENIHKIVRKQDTFKAGNFEQALKDGFLATDRAILGGICDPSSPLLRCLSPPCLARLPISISTRLSLWHIFSSPKHPHGSCLGCETTSLTIAVFFRHRRLRL